jgi:hypothetical protein
MRHIILIILLFATNAISAPDCKLLKKLAAAELRKLSFCSVADKCTTAKLGVNWEIINPCKVIPIVDGRKLDKAEAALALYLKTCKIGYKPKNPNFYCASKLDMTCIDNHCMNLTKALNYKEEPLTDSLIPYSIKDDPAYYQPTK